MGSFVLASKRLGSRFGSVRLFNDSEMFLLRLGPLCLVRKIKGRRIMPCAVAMSFTRMPIILDNNLKGIVGFVLRCSTVYDSL